MIDCRGPVDVSVCTRLQQQEKKERERKGMGKREERLDCDSDCRSDGYVNESGTGE